MSWITLLVILSALGTLVVSWRRAGEVFYAATIAAPPILDEVGLLCEKGDREAALEIGRAARPAWLGETLAVLLDTGSDREIATDDLLYSLRARAEAIRDLRPLARIAAFSGVLGAILEFLVVMMYGERGAGGVAIALAEVETTQRAFLAIVIGMTASTLILYLRARSLVASCHRAARLLSPICEPRP